MTNELNDAVDRGLDKARKLLILKRDQEYEPVCYKSLLHILSAMKSEPEKPSQMPSDPAPTVGWDYFKDKSEPEGEKEEEENKCGRCGRPLIKYALCECDC